MLENKETVLIEVYKEHTASWKHEDNILYKFGAVMLPVSFVALGAPYFKDIKEPSLTILEIISTVGGLILMTCWVSYVYTSHAKIRARFQIINHIEGRIERGLGIKGHKDVPDIRDEIFGCSRLLQLKTHFLEQLIFYVYAIVALMLTVSRVYYKWTICKGLAIVSLTPLIIAGTAIVIALKYKGRISRGEKRLEKLRNSQQTQK